MSRRLASRWILGTQDRVTTLIEFWAIVVGGLLVFYGIVWLCLKRSRSLRHASLRRLRNKYAKGELEREVYERELRRRGVEVGSQQ